MPKPILFSKGFVYAPNSYFSTDVVTESKNIVILPKGYIAPRTADNLAILRRYVKRHFSNPNYNDRRTLAYRWMKQHDSEFGKEAK